MSDVGRATRREVPRSAHAEFTPAPDRDPIALLQLQARQREPVLIPLRHQRMSISPFTYFRGAALPMAWDLARTPTTGITVQLCGDAHLSNFGMFGSPERHLYFDVNDFDETLPGPFEWDVKRLAASLEVAARERGFGAKQRRKTILSAVGAYREAMAGFAPMSSLDVWYAHLDVDRLIPEFLQALDRVRTPAVWKAISTARAPRLDAGVRSAHRDRRWRTPDRARPADRRAARASWPAWSTTGSWRRWTRWSSRTGRPSSGTGGISCPSTAWSTSRTRWSGSAASARGAGSSCSWIAHPARRCSSR